MKQNGNSILAKINQNQSHETGGTIFKSIITQESNSANYSVGMADRWSVRIAMTDYPWSGKPIMSGKISDN